MGIGDWLIATAEARDYHEQYGIRCVFGDKERGKVFWDEDVFRHNPRLIQTPNPGDKVVWIANYPGKRPYITGHDEKRVHWNRNFRASPGEIYLSPEELKAGEAAKGCVIIEPHTKDNVFSRNKAWPWDRWQQLAKMAPVPFLQLGQQPALSGVKHIRTKTFREALAYLANASLLVTTDGALHHAAAALGIPSIVLWGGLISPEILGYGMAQGTVSKDLWHGDEPCGSRSECEHCKRAMRRISVDEVWDAIATHGIPTAARLGRPVAMR